MPKQVFEYRGHRIAIGTRPGESRMSWEFQIDGEKPVVLRTSSATDETSAVAEARSAAISIIDLRDGGT